MSHTRRFGAAYSCVGWPKEIENMPNGGSDCCGTCWFNAKNKGEAGYEHRGDAAPEYCLIRKLVKRSGFVPIS